MPLSPHAVKAEAGRLGFLAAGITDLKPTAHAAGLHDCLGPCLSRAMRYLHRQAKKRKDPARIDREAMRVVVVLDNYFSSDTPGDLEPPRVAKHARGD